MDCIVTRKCLVLPTRQQQGIFTVMCGNGSKLPQGRLRIDISKHFFSERVVRHRTAFLQKVANASSLSVLKRQFGQCLQQPALTSGQPWSSQAIGLGCCSSFSTQSWAGALCLLFSHLHQSFLILELPLTSRRSHELERGVVEDAVHLQMAANRPAVPAPGHCELCLRPTQLCVSWVHLKCATTWNMTSLQIQKST